MYKYFTKAAAPTKKIDAFLDIWIQLMSKGIRLNRTVCLRMHVYSVLGDLYWIKRRIKWIAMDIGLIYT